jgi:prevent-host-death family protein
LWSYVTTTGGPQMSTINLKDAKAGFSRLVDEAIKGEFVTITRHGKPVAALVSVEAAEIARNAIKRRRSGLVAYLRTFPGGEFERNRSPSRDVEL